MTLELKRSSIQTHHLGASLKLLVLLLQLIRRLIVSTWDATGEQGTTALLDTITVC